MNARKPKKRIHLIEICVILVTVVGTFVVLEGIVRQFFPDRKALLEYKLDCEHVSPMVGGLSPRTRGKLPGTWIGNRCMQSVFYANRLVTKTSFTIDSLGRRLHTLPEDIKRACEFAIFLGCSITFGSYIDDPDSLPAQFQSLIRTHRVYNYGVAGSGPHQTLAWLRQTWPLQSIQETKGLIIYTWIDAHLLRLIGSSNYLAWHPILDTPRWVLLPDGQLIQHGAMTSDPQVWLRYLWGRMTTISHLMRRVSVNLPRDAFTNPSHWDLSVAIIQAMRAQTRSNVSQFIVVIWPGNHYGQAHLVPRLRRLGISVLDYSSAFAGMNTRDLHIPYDGHPSPKAYRLIAGRLAKDLFSVKVAIK